jgi:hypothetical protein
MMLARLGVSAEVSAGGLTWAGIVPSAVLMGAPGPPWLFTAARNVGFMPPSTPILTGAAGVPRLIHSAVWTSSRRCFSRTAEAISSGTR